MKLFLWKIDLMNSLHGATKSQVSGRWVDGDDIRMKLTSNKWLILVLLFEKLLNCMLLPRLKRNTAYILCTVTMFFALSCLYFPFFFFNKFIGFFYVFLVMFLYGVVLFFHAKLGMYSEKVEELHHDEFSEDQLIIMRMNKYVNVGILIQISTFMVTGLFFWIVICVFFHLDKVLSNLAIFLAMMCVWILTLCNIKISFENIKREQQ